MEATVRIKARAKANKKRYRKPRIVYALQCPRCLAIRYVGHTVGPVEKRLRRHFQKPISTEMATWFRDLKSQGLRPVLIDLAYARDYGDAVIKEKAWIALASIVYGRTLFNCVHRGDYIAISHFTFRAKRYFRRVQRSERAAARKALRMSLPPKKPYIPPREFTHKGQARSIGGWARLIGVSRERMRQRIEKCLKYKVPVKEALTTPAGETMPSFVGVKAWSRKKASA